MNENNLISGVAFQAGDFRPVAQAQAHTLARRAVCLWYNPNLHTHYSPLPS